MIFDSREYMKKIFKQALAWHKAYAWWPKRIEYHCWIWLNWYEQRLLPTWYETGQYKPYHGKWEYRLIKEECDTCKKKKKKRKNKNAKR